MDSPQKFIEAGYTDMGNTYVGHRYTKGAFSVYHSGHLLIFLREGGLARSFPVDRLEHFSVADMERQTVMILRRFDMKEEVTNYDYYRKN